MLIAYADLRPGGISDPTFYPVWKEKRNREQHFETRASIQKQGAIGANRNRSGGPLYERSLGPRLVRLRPIFNEPCRPRQRVCSACCHPHRTYTPDRIVAGQDE